jgi:hypothetical protein
VEYVHTPRHAGKDGDPVTLVDHNGPAWFSSRMVTDEWRRKVSGGKGRFPTQPNTKPVTKPRHGDNLGGGATSSSSSSLSLRDSSSTGASQAKTPPKPRVRSSLPDVFPAEPDLVWAKNRWLGKGRADLCDGIADEISKFRDYHTANATRSADWSASWRTWAQNAMSYTRAARPPPGTSPSEKPQWKPVEV